MKTLVNNYNGFLGEANDSLTDTAKYNLKIDALKDKIKNNFDKANQSQAKAQELLQKGQADKAAIETLKYRKALAATNLAQIDYKIFMKTEALKKQQEQEKAKK
jgi:hypothetical protein